MDNCAIHAGEETLLALLGLAEALGVRIIFLPKYSPELNPCELVFAKVKNYLRNNRTDSQWLEDIVFALSLISSEDVFLMYLKCIWMDVDSLKLFD